MENKQKCPKCKTIRLASDFEIKRLDMPFKTCKKCRETEDNYRMVKNNKWKFIENLIKPHIVGDNLSLAYQEMAQDAQREIKACQWTEGLIQHDFS